MKRMLLVLLPLTAFAMESGSWKVRKHTTKDKKSSAKELIEIAKELFESIRKDREKLSLLPKDELLEYCIEMSSLISRLIEFSDPDSPISRKTALHFNGIKE